MIQPSSKVHEFAAQFLLSGIRVEPYPAWSVSAGMIYLLMRAKENCVAAHLCATVINAESG